MSAEDVATLSSDYSEKSQDEVELEDGHVICSVLKEVGEPFRPRTRFDRTKHRRRRRPLNRDVFCANRST